MFCLSVVLDLAFTTKESEEPWYGGVNSGEFQSLLPLVVGRVVVFCPYHKGVHNCSIAVVVFAFQPSVEKEISM